MDLVKAAKALALRWPIGSRKRCNLCGKTVAGFLPYRNGSGGLPAAMRELRVVGSDLDNFECPRCGAHDRERHLLFYMRAAGLWDRIPSLKILHFAPERRLARLLSACAPARYVKCDLNPTAPDISEVDMLRMPFSADSFDLVIANHVLEHVADHRTALAEVVRVLAPGGYAVLQTPYSQVLHATFEDPGVSDPRARKELYGQEDHVRLFGRDIFASFEGAGLQSLAVRHHDALPNIEATEFGVNPEEPFFLFRKPGNADQRKPGMP